MKEKLEEQMKAINSTLELTKTKSLINEKEIRLMDSFRRETFSRIEKFINEIDNEQYNDYKNQAVNLVFSHYAQFLKVSKTPKKGLFNVRILYNKNLQLKVLKTQIDNEYLDKDYKKYL